MIEEGDKVKLRVRQTIHTVVAETYGGDYWVIEDLTNNLVWWPPTVHTDPLVRPRFHPWLVDRDSCTLVAKGKPAIVTGGR
jgi:hypothetical protein